ncbi:MAG: hypothetical protein U1E76_08500 [Planctomycetota bacterium]
MLLLLIALPWCGCETYPDIEARPLFSTSRSKLFARTETSMLTPIFDHTSDAGRTEWAIHPLWRRIATAEQTEVQVLSPLFEYDQRQRRTRAWLIPLIYYQNIERPEGRDWDLLAFPFFMGGGDAGERYFGLFPLAGYLRSFAAYDSITFVLFPLYYSATKRVTETRTNYNITPLFGWTEGGVLDGSFHIYPFYGQSIWKGKYDKRTVLFPFFNYDRYGLDTDHPATLFAIWPLWMRDHADNHEFWTLLWPLFRFNWEEPDRLGSEPNSARQRYSLIDFPWPLVHYENGRKFEKLRIFPFYSHYRSHDLESRAYLIPLIWDRAERVRDGVRSSFYFVPFVHHQVTSYEDFRGSDSYLKIWPFYHQRFFADGRADVGVLSPLPLMIENWLHYIDENWGVFWSLYRFRRDDRGAEWYSALFSVIHGYRDGFERRFAVGPLYDYREFGDEETIHRLLLGIVSFGEKRGRFTLSLGPWTVIE